MDTRITSMLLKEIGLHNNAKVDIKDIKEISAMAKRIEGSVESFLQKNNMVKNQNFASDEVNPSNESFDISGVGKTTLGIDAIERLVDAAGIAPCYKNAAMESLAVIMTQHLGQSTSAAWGSHNMRSQNQTNGIQSRALTTLFPVEVMNDFSQIVPGSEAFGVNIDSAVPDMKMAITVSLLRFRTNLVPRMMPVRGISQPNVQYIKENLEVYSITADIETPVKRLVDLYANPSTVLNELKTIIPLKDNDTASALVSDGVIKFSKLVNVLKLSLDTTAPGYTSVNRTDTVADNVKIATVYVTLTATIEGSPVVETFAIAIPASDGRLTRPTNAADSAIRNADIKYIHYLTAGAKDTSDATSVILAAAGANEGVKLSLTVKPTINLKNGQLDALGSVTVASHSLTGEAISGGLTARVALIAPTLEGYAMDAKFSEENLRKSDIAVRSQRQPFSYDIPTGRNYSYDYAIGQNNAEDSANQLTKIIRIGQDSKVLNLTVETLNTVYDLVQLYLQNPLDPNKDPGANYVAGSKVRPYVFSGTMDFSSITSIRDADRTGDIKARAKVYLNAVTSELMQKSFFQYELAGDTTPTFVCITSPTILGNIIGQPHIHNHLEKGDSVGKLDGIEYVLMLDNGVKLNIITTTFDDYIDQIVMIPTIPGSVESELNFAHNWDYGTMVGHYTPSGDGAHHRLFANIRELPTPTNPIGAIITVAGIDKVTFVATA